MGYAGGKSPSPTYRSIGDHTECLQVDFDPETVSYEELLDLALTSHDPTRAAFKRQYASLVLTHDGGQLSTAQAAVERFEAVLGRKLATRVERLEHFYLAEAYHQKYVWQHDSYLAKTFPLVDDYSLWAVATAMGVEPPYCSAAKKPGEISQNAR